VWPPSLSCTASWCSASSSSAARRVARRALCALACTRCAGMHAMCAQRMRHHGAHHGAAQGSFGEPGRRVTRALCVMRAGAAALLVAGVGARPACAARHSTHERSCACIGCVLALTRSCA
jgi:hypothetical protein